MKAAILISKVVHELLDFAERAIVYGRRRFGVWDDAAPLIGDRAVCWLWHAAARHKAVMPAIHRAAEIGLGNFMECFLRAAEQFIIGSGIAAFVFTVR